MKILLWNIFFYFSFLYTNYTIIYSSIRSKGQAKSFCILVYSLKKGIHQLSNPTPLYYCYAYDRVKYPSPPNPSDKLFRKVSAVLNS